MWLAVRPVARSRRRWFTVELTKPPTPECLAEPTGNVVFGQLVFRIGEYRLGVIHFY